MEVGFVFSLSYKVDRGVTDLECFTSTGRRQTGDWPLVNQVQSLQRTRPEDKLQPERHEGENQTVKERWNMHMVIQDLKILFA